MIDQALKIAEIVKNGGKVTVVGTKGMNFPPKYREHAQIEFWDSTDPSTYRRELSSNCKIVIVTRFVNHPLWSRINDEARKRKLLIIPGLQGTGKIKELLREIVEPLPVIAKEKEEIITKETTPDNNDNPMPIHETTLKEFVAHHINININWNVRGAITREAERLYAIAQQEGKKTTLKSLKMLIGRSFKNKLPSSTQNVVVDIKGNNTELLINDAIAALQLLKTEISKIEKENKRFKKLFESIKLGKW